MLYKRIEEQLRGAVAQVLPDADPEAIQVRPCPEPKFGDYQCNSLMALAKERKRNPRQLAQEVLAKLEVKELADSVEIAGPGFLNFRAKREALGAILKEAVDGKHLFYQSAAPARTILVDFSSPNVAKAMHVGHIRSTILGDAISRILRLLGHHVITDNHIGDWGTQFGKLIVGWKRELNEEALAKDPLGEMERLYKKINAEFDQNEEIASQARQELVKLQSGDAENTAIWKRMIELSLREFDQVYARLGVSFNYALGESYYNSALKGVVQRLKEKQIARESEGATVVFFDRDYKVSSSSGSPSSDSEPSTSSSPAIIEKRDGGANYTTTDLATLEYRIETWKPHEIVYVTDARQQLHFRQLFGIFREWMPDVKVKLTHVWFGMILGPDNKPFKTRTGENIKLTDLLNEAEERALAVVTEKNPELPESERAGIARIVGIGAIKYSDLLPNRQSDYVFSWEKMLALNGNTAPYLQYAYTRVRSIFRKAGESAVEKREPVFLLNFPDELALARHLMNFGLVLEAVIEEYRPNYLCTFLYELAGLFARFYESCPVLKAEPQEKADRLALCDLTGRVLKLGLNLLGIETTERM